jgi:hypothetical protein
MTELQDPANFSGMNLTRMVLRDLRQYWGDEVEITGTSVRDILYWSDGNMSTTPDAIGMYKKSPLIYKGRAVGTIFNIHGQDVLRSSANVVYWLPKPWWEKFHDGYRGMHKEYPWPTGFVCTNLCQRWGKEGYGRGIYLASMTQGQTVGSWSMVQLPGTLSYSILQHAKAQKVSYKIPKKLDPGIALSRMQLVIASQREGVPQGRWGTVCVSCSMPLTEPFGICVDCGFSHSYDSHDQYCTHCGKYYASCNCGSETRYVVTMSSYKGREQYRALQRALKEIRA